MTSMFDQHAINHATVALGQEMTPCGSKRHPTSDLLFLGGAQPTDEDRTILATFGLAKNYSLVFASFDPADPASGPISYDVVVTNGVTQAIGLKGGRLWRCNRRSPAVLLFPEIGAIIKVSAKGRIVVREMSGLYHDHGYELAREGVIARTARKPGGAPVVRPIGKIVMVLDFDLWTAMHHAA